MCLSLVMVKVMKILRQLYWKRTIWSLVVNNCLKTQVKFDCHLKFIFWISMISSISWKNEYVNTRAE
jgi:hypothetical protein